MLRKMVEVARHTMHPGLVCIWNPGLSAYECFEPEAVGDRALEILKAHPNADSRATLKPGFKLVFITAAIGTVFFVTLCVAITLLSTGELPPVQQELVRGFLALAQVGFGAIVGLLGAKAL